MIGLQDATANLPILGIVTRALEGIIGRVRDGFESLVDEVASFAIVGFIELQNPHGSGPANEAWMQLFEVSMAIFPIMVILGLLSMPFADEQKTTLWRQGLRMVGAISLIAVSRPLIGFGVEFSNAITLAILPDAGEFMAIVGPEMVFTSLLGSAAAGVGLGLGIWVGIPIAVTATLYIIAMIIVTIMFLQLRHFFIYAVYIGSPILIVFWMIDWGLLESVNEFANKWFRMGLYTMMTGPLLAIVVLSLIALGPGIMDSAEGVAAGLATFLQTMILITLAPILFMAVIWKSISWAGEPVGAGQAMAAVGAGVMGGLGKMAGGGGEGGAAGSAGGGGGEGEGVSGSNGETGSEAGTISSSGGSFDGEMGGEGETVPKTQANTGGTESDVPGGAGTGDEGPPDEVTGTDSPESGEETQSHVQDLKDGFKDWDWKNRNVDAAKEAVGTYSDIKDSAAERFNLNRQRAKGHEARAEDVAENQETFNEAVDMSAGENGQVDMDQAAETIPDAAEGQGTVDLKKTVLRSNTKTKTVKCKKATLELGERVFEIRRNTTNNRPKSTTRKPIQCLKSLRQTNSGRVPK